MSLNLPFIKRNKLVIFSLSFALLGTVSGCRGIFSSKKLKNLREVKVHSATNPTLRKNKTSLTKNEVDLNAFYYAITKPIYTEKVKFNSKIEITSDQFIPDLSSTIYIEKNKKIWLNLSALFVTVARGLAVPSQLTAYETIGKNYIQGDYQYLNNLLGVNFIQYDNFQNLLYGKPILPIIPKYFIVKKQNKTFIAESLSDNNVEVTNSFLSKNKVTYFFSSDLKLDSTKISNKEDGHELTIAYHDFFIINKDAIPKKIEILVSSSKRNKNKVKINILHSFYTLESMPAEIQIPRNYKKIR